MKYLYCLVALAISFNSFSQKGKDGAKLVTTTEIVNAFTTLTVDASAGDTSITVINSSLNTNFTSNLAQGDLVMIYQVQGATIRDSIFFNWWDYPNSSKFKAEWGQIESYNNAGNYEFVQVESVPNATSINFDCALQNNYTASGNVLIIRVPRYSSLTINSGGTLTTSQWNGTSGGVLAVEVDGLTTINSGGNIDVSSLGFRGGTAVNGNQNSLFGGLRYADANTLEGAEKGEGIAGDQVVYDSFNDGGARFCRGAAANAGGGGNAHNAGGGGGANAGDINAWNDGIGNPDVSNPNYVTAWGLDTSFVPIVTSSGGGRGGYSILRNNRNELTEGPNNANWGGDNRRDNGGLGGRPLDYSLGKIFLGGGGGAGEGDNGDASDGGNGGGLIFLNTYGDITGAGNIISNGEDGEDVAPNSAPFGGLAGVDGVGGAGAGGTIILQTTGNVSLTGTINANGGNGGDQILLAGLFANIDEAEGPGGGGGGGYIAISNGTPTRNTTGGANGTTNSPYVSNFPANGATMGGNGINNASINAFDYTVNDTTVCANTSATLTAIINGTLPPGASVEWYDAPFNGNLLFTGNPFTTPSLATTSTFYVKICPAPYTIPVTVTVNPCPVGPIASFSASDSTICAGECIDFTDLSSGTITSWSWHFVGANTTTSSVQNPTNICYSTPGSYDVSLTVNDGTNTDSLFIANFITVIANDTAVFTYNTDTFCLTDPNPLPNNTGTLGGTYTIDNSGSINASTGEINLTASGVGSYVVTYTTNGPCPDTATFNVNITNSADATINAAGPFCEDEPSTNLSAAQTGGTWSGNGITNATNGTFDPATAGAGSHQIIYTITGSCGDADTINIVVNPRDTATFTYPSGSYCLTDPNPLPTGIVTTGGTFSIDNSGVINATTGEINIVGSGLGSYVVTYITNGACPDTATFNVNIVNSADATINAAGPFCENEPSTNLSAAQTGGTWSGNGITNPTNGTFDPATAGAGSHQIIYTITGSCGDADTINIVVNPSDTAAFTYPSGSYCLADPDPSPTITGTTGGSFSIDNSGVINNSTGVIDISASGLGSYVVTYITNGACPDTATFNVNIVNSADATITPAGPFCENDPSTNLVAAQTGGSWSGTGITNATNGTFDPATAGAGIHQIIYTITGSCGDVDTINITVNPSDDASFSYSPTTFCDTDPNPVPTGIVTTGGTFTIDNGGTINASTGEVNLSASGAGSYVITYTTNGPCPNSDTISITVNNCSIPPVANFSSNGTSLCINDCIDFSDLSTGGTPTSWNWYFEGGSPSTSNLQNPLSICYDTSGTYGISLVVSNAFGNDSIYIANYITVDSCNNINEVLTIPNVFSPNSDGENDLFKPFGNNINTLYMVVYNRWGELIYKTELVNSGWDGRTTAGTECSEGTYFYLIEVNGETYKGTVTLLR